MSKSIFFSCTVPFKIVRDRYATTTRKKKKPFAKSESRPLRCRKHEIYNTAQILRIKAGGKELQDALSFHYHETRSKSAMIANLYVRVVYTTVPIISLLLGAFSLCLYDLDNMLNKSAANAH